MAAARGDYATARRAHRLLGAELRAADLAQPKAAGRAPRTKPVPAANPDAVSALIGLGIARADALAALRPVDPILPLEQQIVAALRALGRARP